MKKEKEIEKQEVTTKEIREIAENIIDKTSDCESDYDAVEDVEEILKSMFDKMSIAVKNVHNCKCKDCACGKK